MTTQIANCFKLISLPLCVFASHPHCIPTVSKCEYTKKKVSMEQCQNPAAHWIFSSLVNSTRQISFSCHLIVINTLRRVTTENIWTCSDSTAFVAYQKRREENKHANKRNEMQINKQWNKRAKNNRREKNVKINFFNFIKMFGMKEANALDTERYVRVWKRNEQNNKYNKLYVLQRVN